MEFNRLQAISITAAVIAGMAICAGVTGKDNSSTTVGSANQRTNIMRITIKAGDETIPCTMEDNATTREFVSQLPLTLTLTDYNGTEKISDLPKKLTTKDSPEGVDPAVGDITYYAPWGNLAIFYKDFGYSRGLVRLGRLEAGLKTISRSGELRVTIQRSNQ